MPSHLDSSNLKAQVFGRDRFYGLRVPFYWAPSAPSIVTFNSTYFGLVAARGFCRRPTEKEHFVSGLQNSDFLPRGNS